MYSAPYGYGSAAGQAYNAAPQGQNPQMKPGGPGQHQPQQQQQQQQQIMYNQQFPMGPGGGGGHYPGGPNPGAMMPGGAGPAGMMQNTAMPQMAANGQMGYQPPYSGSPYGPGVPSSAAPPGQYNPNYMMANSMGGGFAMNPAGMSAQQAQQQQQMMQRMQHSQQAQQHAQQNPTGMGTPTPQRQFSGPQGTPNPGHQSQFGTPQPHQGTPQNQTPTPAPQSANSATTPQTPTFPPTVQGAAVNGGSTPVSPGTQARDAERMGLLLDINTELLFEAVHLRQSLDEIKREASNPANGTTPEQLKDRKGEEDAFNQDFSQVYRRLQANLTYLASITSHKPENPRQPAPMYLSAPPLNLRLRFRPTAAGPGLEKVDAGVDREDRDRFLREHYHKLQALFPGIDPTKEPTFRPQPKPGMPNPAMAMQNAQRMPSIGGGIQGQQSMASSAPSPVPSTHQTTPQMSTMPGPPGPPTTQPGMSA